MVQEGRASGAGSIRRPAMLAGLLAACGCAAAPHSFEYVAEHLPEAAMNNRLATLPLWDTGAAAGGGWRTTLQGAAARTQAARLTLDGPMASVGASRPLTDGSSAIVIGFVDALRFSGGNDQRPLDILFGHPPLALPAEAQFS